ncbi:MAG: hypothetical protein ACE366_10080 [Bradymonadia bacterium]
MTLRSVFLRSGLCLGAALLFLPASASAARKVKCDSCDSCTEALSQPGARVELTADLKSASSVCVTVAGDTAEFNGGDFTLEAGEVGVQVTAARAHVRRLKIKGGAVGVGVTGSGATVLGVHTTGTKQGIVADGAESLRVVRSSFTGGAVGVALGQPKDKTCPSKATMRSPGVVLSRVKVTGAQVGIAACEATPVIVASEITGNKIGLLQGNPKGASKDPAQQGPYDPCVCGPELAEVKQATTLFFSSGCGGCKVHEGWLPEVQSQGYDILMRKTGAENRQAMEKFDGFLRQCAPEVNDAIGVPGCVPNYACLPGHSVFKRRGEGKQLIRDAQIQGPEAMAEFAARCAAEAQSHFNTEGTCVAHAVRETKLCGNTVDAQLARPLTGDGNTCGTVKGQGKSLGCASKCQ